MQRALSNEAPDLTLGTLALNKTASVNQDPSPALRTSTMLNTNSSFPIVADQSEANVEIPDDNTSVISYWEYSGDESRTFACKHAFVTNSIMQL